MNFTLLRIPVTIHPQFLLLLIFFTGIYQDLSLHGLLYGLIFTCSLLIHELGHGMAARYFGASPQIILEGFGGVTSYSNRMSEKQNFIVTLCGPLLESILIVIPYFLLKFAYFQHSIWEYYLYLIMKINIFWLLFNLLPIEPLDGGKISRYLLKIFFKEQEEKISNILGMVAVICGLPYYLLNKSYIFGCLLAMYGFKYFQDFYTLFRRNRLSPFALFNKGREHCENQEIEKAKLIFKKLSKSADDYIRILAVETLATLLYNEKEFKQAYRLLLSHCDQLKNGKSLLCKLAFEEGNFELIARYAHEIYALEPTYEIALLNSKALAQLNHPLASGWAITASLFEK